MKGFWKAGVFLRASNVFKLPDALDFPKSFSYLYLMSPKILCESAKEGFNDKSASSATSMSKSSSLIIFSNSVKFGKNVGLRL